MLQTNDCIATNLLYKQSVLLIVAISPGLNSPHVVPCFQNSVSKNKLKNILFYNRSVCISTSTPAEAEAAPVCDVIDPVSNGQENIVNEHNKPNRPVEQPCQSCNRHPLKYLGDCVK